MSQPALSVSGRLFSRLRQLPSLNTLAAGVMLGPHKVSRENRQGFTLVEMASVLVIIGLIVGGIFVGQALVDAAAIRGQIGQIEKFNAAVNTFKTKYNNHIPGDMPAADAAAFGFATRTGDPGRGNGDGLLGSGAQYAAGSSSIAGETALF